MNNGPNVNISSTVQSIGGGLSGATVTGDLIMSPGSNIHGDFSAAILTDRTTIQSNVVNGASKVNIAPNGTSTDSSINVDNSSSLANDYRASLYVSSTESGVSGGTRGTGTALPFNIYNNNKLCIALDTLGNIVVGQNTPLPTNATNGFLYIPKCAGTPTGTPTAQAGQCPLVIDSTNSKMYFHNGTAWVALN